MGVGAGLYMCDVVVKKFTFAISSPDEFLSYLGSELSFLAWQRAIRRRIRNIHVIKHATNSSIYFIANAHGCSQKTTSLKSRSRMQFLQYTVRNTIG